MKKSILILFALLLTVSVSRVYADESLKKSAVVYFITFDPEKSPRFSAFFEKLKELGDVDGQNIDLLYLSADNNGQRYPALIKSCLDRQPAVIATTTTPAAKLLKEATRSVPIVMVALGDPLGTGLVDSLSRPSENITGMSLMVPHTAVKRLEILKDLVPGIRHVLVLSFLADPIAPLQVKPMQEVAEQMKLTLHVHDIKIPEDIPSAFEAAISEGVKGAVVTEESMFNVHRARLAKEAADRKIPVVYPFLLPVTDAGGLMAYAAHAPDLHRQAAIYVDRILKGDAVSNLPVQQPTTFDLVINMRAAKALNLPIPEDILIRATEIVE